MLVFTLHCYRLAGASAHDTEVLMLKGLHNGFGQEDQKIESKHFQNLCEKFNNYKQNWKTLTPIESSICCTPEKVNSRFGFNWSPKWFWANKDGWICSFKFHKNLLLVGVIETLQVVVLMLETISLPAPRCGT